MQGSNNNPDITTQTHTNKKKLTKLRRKRQFFELLYILREAHLTYQKAEFQWRNASRGMKK